MSLGLYFVAGFLVVNALAVIGAVGKARKPVTHGTAVNAVILCGAMAAYLVVAALRWRHG